MRRRTLTTIVPVVIFCIAAIVQPWLPVGWFLGIMSVGLALMLVGFFDLRREWRQLQAAFPHNEAPPTDEAEG